MSFHPGMGVRPRRAPCALQLILPGLVWPAGGLTASLAALRLPGLAALLGRATLRRAAPQPWAQWLAAQCGSAALPFGALRLAGETRPPGIAGREVLCVDPVGLHFTSDALLLRAPRELRLDDAESAALITCLNAEFGAVGEWFAATPQRWYLLLDGPVKTRFQPLADAQGRPVALFGPEGEGAREWNRLLNAIQITLTDHPVNRARAERGELRANAIWPWGAGEPANLRAPATALCSDDPLLAGLAVSTGMTRLSPAQVCAGRPGTLWWYASEAFEAVLAGDLNTWLGALEAFDRTLVQPAFDAWRAGRVAHLSLLAPSDKVFLRADLGRLARYQPWRRALAPAALAPHLQTIQAPAP
ncbi:MAG: hypothetical protein REI09_14020 [Candidatus Dactylopiibacterium sp.]|nr:hypothetical protein [Candidatus Dactylopiibacterium sp.]